MLCVRMFVQHISEIEICVCECWMEMLSGNVRRQIIFMLKLLTRNSTFYRMHRLTWSSNVEYVEYVCGWTLRVCDFHSKLIQLLIRIDIHSCKLFSTSIVSFDLSQHFFRFCFRTSVLCSDMNQFRLVG